MTSPASPDLPITARTHAIVGVTALAAVLLYLDRVCISMTAVYVREDLGIDPVRMGQVLGAFFFSYALAQVPSGWFSDRWGARLMMVIYILAWSLFTGLTGLAVGFLTLLAARLAFGVGQAGAYPTAASLLSRWVPSAKRGRASSLVALGGRLGGATAPLLTAALLVALTPPTTTSQLREGDLLAPIPLAKGLLRSGDSTPAQLGQRVRAHFSPEGNAGAAALAALEPPQSPDSESVTRLREELNQVLNDPALTEGLDWSNVGLAREARGLMQKPRDSRTALETERLNRLALEASYPNTIRQIHGRSWRTVMFLYAALGVVVAGAYWLIVRDRPPASAGTAASSKVGVSEFPVGLLARSRNLWFGSLAQFGLNVGWVFLITLLPDYLAEVFAVPLEERGTMSMVPLLAACVGMFFGGRLTDRLVAALGLRRGRALPVGLAPFFCAAACLCCPLLPRAWDVVGALAFMAFVVDLAVPAIWAFVQDIGGRHVGSALGWGNMWGNFGAALSPVLLSEVQVRFGWNYVFVACAVSFVIAGIAGLCIDATQPLEAETTPRSGAV
jgi:MFS family permease